MRIDDIRIYRISHIENLPHILRFGITHRSSLEANPHFRSIGDQSLIETRNKTWVYVNNGNLMDMNCQEIKLGDFTPFYFGVRMPMLYVIQNGGNFVEKATHPEDIIYLKCSLKSIVDSGLNFYFSDGHATDKFTSFYDRTRINDLPSLLDWKAIQAPFWAGQENLDLKRKKQAEFLVENDVPPKHIVKIGCFNQVAANRIEKYGITFDRIAIVPAAYY